MKKIVFTICSNNYLAQAKTLGDSLLKYNNDYKFFIILCDKKSNEIDYSSFDNYTVLEVEELQIHEFSEMKKMYDITELNTSVKPFVFRYIYDRENADIVYYIDPDIKIYDSLSYLEEKLETNNFVFTPHILMPIKGKEYPNLENELTSTGLYNLGFLATKKSTETDKMLQWWMDRLSVGCYVRRHIGTFVDQLPMIHVPVFYAGACISKHLGLNVAHWNLQERSISLKEDKYYVNNDTPLIFFHFSGYSPATPNLITKRWKNYTFNQQDNDLKKLFLEYHEDLLNNGYDKFKPIKCIYIKDRKKERILLYIQRCARKVMIYIDKLIDIIRKNDL